MPAAVSSAFFRLTVLLSVDPAAGFTVYSNATKTCRFCASLGLISGLRAAVNTILPVASHRDTATRKLATVSCQRLVGEVSFATSEAIKGPKVKRGGAGGHKTIRHAGHAVHLSPADRSAPLLRLTAGKTHLLRCQHLDFSILKSFSSLIILFLLCYCFRETIFVL